MEDIEKMLSYGRCLYMKSATYGEYLALALIAVGTGIGQFRGTITHPLLAGTLFRIQLLYRLWHGCLPRQVRRAVTVNFQVCRNLL